MEIKQNKAVKITKIVLLSIFYLIVGILLLFSIATLSKRRDDQIPNLFGFGFLAVHEQADSMKGPNSDSFNPGDLVFIKVLSDKQKEKLQFDKMKEEGTVVSFYDYGIKAINTHRVIDNGALSSGEEYIKTQGDNENEPDDMLLEKKDVIGIYRGKLKGFGKPISYMQTPKGFAIVVIIPMLLLLFWQGYVLITDIYQAKSEKLHKELEIEKEEERERIRREILEEMEKEEE